MPSKKSYGKTSKRASVNLGNNLSKIKTENKNSKNSKSSNKNEFRFAINKTAVICVILALLGGFLLTKFIVRKDCFVLNGNDEQVVVLGKGYVDEGAKVVAFGIDDSAKVEIETNLEKRADGKYYANEVGTYYMIYTVDNIKYGSIVKIQKIRLITFVEPSEGVEPDGE